MKVDLHIHSDFSDGKYAPAKIVEDAARNGLGLIALTDHDTLEGIAEALDAAQKHPHLRVIPGIEFSTWLGDHELHILGYGIAYANSDLVALAHTAIQNRTRRVARMLEVLQAHNVRLQWDDVKNGLRSVSLGRLHVAQALRDHRYVTTIREAFERYLSYDTGVIALVSEDFLDVSEAVRGILRAGGIPVLAHPTIEIFDRYLPQLIECGLRGVEVFKTSRSAIEEYYFETVAKDKHLVVTGGSDWHGHRVHQRLGDFYVESARVERFLQALHIT